MYPQIEPYSAGFNKIDLTVVPSESETSGIHTELRASILQHSGATEDSEQPLLFRYPRFGGYFEVHTDNGLPVDQIKLPMELIQAFDIDRIPDLESFLVTKPHHAQRIRDIQCQ